MIGSVHHAGADPGLYGALAVLRDGKLIAAWVMPTRIEGGRREVNLESLVHVTREALSFDPRGVAIELVGSRPEQGVASMFNFGRSYGALEAALVAAGGKVTRLSPLVWKAHHRLIGAGKDESIARAEELFGSDFKRFHTRKVTKSQIIGIAEAALMARVLHDRWRTQVEGLL